MGLHAFVSIALQYLDAFQLIIGEVLWPLFDRFVPGGAQEAGDGKSLSQMFLVVPAIKIRFFVCRDISPDHQEPCTFFLGHLVLLIAMKRFPLHSQRVIACHLVFRPQTWYKLLQQDSERRMQSDFLSEMTLCILVDGSL